MRSRQAYTVVFATVLTACGAGDMSIPEFVVRDSSGISVVENGVPLGRAAERWQVLARPQVVVGGTDTRTP